MPPGDQSELDAAQQDAARQIELLKQQLAAAQRMAALGELVSTTTHEFNNVLMTVINYAKMGLRHHDAATRDKAFSKILSASQRTARITAGVLGFARGKSQGFEPVDLAKLVVDTLELLEREMMKYRIKIETHMPAVPPVAANRGQVQQILMNLLTNARQAMPQGGRLLVGLAHDPALETVELTVHDSGSGIAPEHLRRIFDPFFTTKNGPDASGKGGTGLGLSACRDIVEAHRGKIRVESSVGLGTAFIIKLPVAAASVTPITTVVLASNVAEVPVALAE